LNVAALDLRELGAAERGEDVKPQRALVLADDRGLVAVTGFCPDRTVRDSVDEGLRGRADRLRCAGEPNTLRRLCLGPGAPASCLGEGSERLRGLAFADRVIRGHAVARFAVATLAVA